jgi:hypothetical protein
MNNFGNRNIERLSTASAIICVLYGFFALVFNPNAPIGWCSLDLPAGNGRANCQEASNPEHSATPLLVVFHNNKKWRLTVEAVPLWDEPSLCAGFYGKMNWPA